MMILDRPFIFFRRCRLWRGSSLVQILIYSITLRPCCANSLSVFSCLDNVFEILTCSLFSCRASVKRKCEWVLLHACCQAWGCRVSWWQDICAMILSEYKPCDINIRISFSSISTWSGRMAIMIWGHKNRDHFFQSFYFSSGTSCTFLIPFIVILIVIFLLEISVVWKNWQIWLINQGGFLMYLTPLKFWPASEVWVCC